MIVSEKDYEDVTVYGLDDSGEAELLAKQTECTFIWSTKDGHPVGVIMNFVFRDGRFWLTASNQRARVPAVRRDPRVSIAVSSHGSEISSRRSLTYKGRCVIHEDEPTKEWFYPALAAAVRPGDPGRGRGVREAPRLAASGGTGGRAGGPDRLRQRQDVARHPRCRTQRRPGPTGLRTERVRRRGRPGSHRSTSPRDDAA